MIGFDGLSLFFLFTFQLLSLAASLYAISYLRPYIERGLSIRAHVWFFTLLILAMQLVAVVHHALVFLVVWELMAIGGYFSIVLDKDKEEVRLGGFWYFVATHAGVLLLYVCFLTLHEITGSWNFDDFARHAAYDPRALAVVLLTGLAGFGIKAGFMPFHAWLPNAHSAAPTHVSALLSAINIKAGIYGMARLMMILPALNAAYGWGLLAVSLVSAVLGVWYALAQHDIKRLLAYHSVENIGIIGLGLSVAWLGRCYALPELVLLGFAGALLHTLNHAIFKGLLFFGAGNVYLRAHTGDIEKMGGFRPRHPADRRDVPRRRDLHLRPAAVQRLRQRIHHLQKFLPRGQCMTRPAVRDYAPLVMLVSAVGLAFMGGLAVACFTKLYGIVFLGANRSGDDSRRQSEQGWSSVALLGLAGLCAVIGIFPQTGLRLVAPALGELADGAQAPADWSAPLGQLQIVFALFLALVAGGLHHEILAAKQDRRARSRDMGLRLCGGHAAHAIHGIRLCRGTGETRTPDAQSRRALETASRHRARRERVQFALPRPDGKWLAGVQSRPGTFARRVPLDSKRQHPPLRRLSFRRDSFLPALRTRMEITAPILCPGWRCALFLAGAPLLAGIVNKLKARLSGRFGATVFQPYYELWRLAQKETVYSTSAGFISRLAPVIVWCTVAFAALLLPLGRPAVISFSGDIILFAYLLALGRFFQILAALDAAGSFEGMGASREARFAVFAEPIFFFTIGSLALVTRHYSFETILAGISWSNPLFVVFISVGLLSLFFLMMAECSRMPVDDPNTHLELTMIHEVMILDASGFDLMLYQYAAALKLLLYSTLAALLLNPFGVLGRRPASSSLARRSWGWPWGWPSSKRSWPASASCSCRSSSSSPPPSAC